MNLNFLDKHNQVFLVSHFLSHHRENSSLTDSKLQEEPQSVREKTCLPKCGSMDRLYSVPFVLICTFICKVRSDSVQVKFFE